MTVKSTSSIIPSLAAASTPTTRVPTIITVTLPAIANVGWSPDDQLRIGSLFTYSVSDTGNPNTIFDPRPIDHFLTERWLIGPHIDWRPTDWWDHKFIFSYDHERQINDPNEDGFVGPTRALFERTQVDYQNNLRPTSWLTLTSGFFYSRVNAGQERPFVSQAFGPQPTFISDHTQEVAGFLQATLTPVENLIFVAGGRLDHFNEFGGVWTYRVAGSYKIDQTNTTLHSSVATGFSPPSSQDIIFGNNPNLNPEKDFGWDIGVRQELWKNRVALDLTYFHNDLSNVIGFNGLFQTLNLGAAETQGLEAALRAQPIPNLVFMASYTYLDATKTSSADISQPEGARLPRRPRNELYVSASYLWWKRLRTVVEAKCVNAREELNFGGPNFDIEDYSFVNIAAEYEVTPHLSVFGRIDNLTNEHYSEVFGFPALGRAAYGGREVTILSSLRVSQITSKTHVLLSHHVIKTFREQTGRAWGRQTGWHSAARVSEAGTLCVQSRHRDGETCGEGCCARERARHCGDYRQPRSRQRR